MKIDFSDKFEKNLVDEINEYGTLMSFKEGEVIMEYGKVIRMMPLIVKGTIKILRQDEEGREILLYYLSTKETCSMAYAFCLDAKQSEIKAIAEEETTIVAIPPNKLDEWLCKYPTWKSYIMQSFNDRFMEMIKSIETIAFKKLDERLVQYLKDKQRIAHSSVIKISHHQIADELGSSRVVISRLLKTLENDKRLLLYRNEIKLLSKF
jgi:CRP/FNR family transcriptional regulator